MVSRSIGLKSSENQNRNWNWNRNVEIHVTKWSRYRESCGHEITEKNPASLSKYCDYYYYYFYYNSLSLPYWTSLTLPYQSYQNRIVCVRYKSIFSKVSFDNSLWSSLLRVCDHNNDNGHQSIFSFSVSCCKFKLFVSLSRHTFQLETNHFQGHLHQHVLNLDFFNSDQIKV